MSVNEFAVPSLRAQITERRTYFRPTNDEGTEFETFEQHIDRVVGHQRWLWERAKAGMQRHSDGTWIMETLDKNEEDELNDLKQLLLDRKLSLSGRTHWLGGTDVAKRREASQFNCAFLEVETVHDVVDALWLLLQGTGVGFRPVVGNLNGFFKEIPELEIIRSTRTTRGHDENIETFDRETGVWTIVVGDSAEAWAKFFGKLIAGKYNAKKLVVDFSQVRPAGFRLKGYGWISSGDSSISVAVKGIFDILNARAGCLLTAMDILDIMNWLGTILSSRRSSEIALYPITDPEWHEFGLAKKDHDKVGGKWWRSMSNNSWLFYQKPTKQALSRYFRIIKEAGGSEPGLINAEYALRRAAYFKGVNPCAEILLGNRSFCNLVETVLYKFNGDSDGLHYAHHLAARANYRQTCVNLDDGVLQRGWHELNEFLRLCGVGVTGIVSWEEHDSAAAWKDLRDTAVDGANSMADDLDMPRPQLITTIKPSGTRSKVVGMPGNECPEGAHVPISRYVFNWIRFSKTDPFLKKLEEAGYEIKPEPYQPEQDVIVKVPAEFADSRLFTEVQVGDDVAYVNRETAVSQLDRYKLLMDNYVDHNCSITVYYDEEEVPSIVQWLIENWDHYIGVSFLPRVDPLKSAEDLGYKYLPQEAACERSYKEYIDKLKPLVYSEEVSADAVDYEDACAGGACPIR
jgi:adenosylcobalamin-dependent ribonucleoside-triphosphate reductase